MPRAAKELTALKVARLTDPGLYAVGGAQGLHLQVTPSGARSWIARLTVGTRTNAAGKPVQHRRDFGLGAYPTVSLAEAREKAREFRTKIAAQVDPLAEKFAAKARAATQRAAMMTVNAAVQQFIEDMQGKWAGDPKGVSKRQALLKTYITPYIGHLLITDVEVPHVVTVLKPIWEPSPATAERVASLLRNTFDWAKAHGYRTGDNPASSEVLNKVLPSLGESGKQPALPFASLPGFMADLRGRDHLTARALEVTILSALRTSEAIGATWGEVNFDGGVWTVPAARMKLKRADHRVPLTKSLLTVLRQLHEARTSDFVFPGARDDKPLSDGAMLELLKQMDYKDASGRRITTHGFRATFSTWASECTDHPAEVREMALAHKIKNEVEAAYRRGDLLDKRRLLMNEWDAFCASSPPAKKS
ncbi:MAG: integrase arm-type DNA-binding domain-containing protein [Rubrivivax sp.]|nr:integrase arm-type DNA-binding domain-containing protein [Rubrivivax sp.]